MADTNMISTTLSAADLADIKASLAAIRAKLPFLISLTNEERQTKAKLGDGRVALDEDASTLMSQNPDLVPTFSNFAEVTKDRDLRASVDEVRLALESLLNDVDDTELELGHELYKAYLAFYANAQQAAARAVSGAQTVVDTLAKYFARPSRKPAAVSKP